MCNVMGCEGQTQYTNERPAELRRFPYSRDHHAGAAIICRGCHTVEMQNRKTNNGLVLTWDQGTVYEGSK